MEAGNGHRTGENTEPRDAENQLREEEETEPSDESSPLSKKIQKEYGASIFMLFVTAYGNDHTIVPASTSLNKLNVSQHRYILYSVMRI